jgi:hypothetical protein
MEEQIQYQPAATPKSGLVKMIVINIVISALVSLVVSYAAVTVLTSHFSGAEKRISVLEQKVDKILSKFVIK